MTTEREETCVNVEKTCAYALGAVSAEEVPAIQAHLATCARCRDELSRLQPVVEALAYWPTDVLRPQPSLRERLARRIAAEDGTPVVLPPRRTRLDPPWENVAPGIACKILAEDRERHTVSMLVRLDPGTDYPPHVHAGVEELHLLHGELWIDERKLVPGDYNRAEPGTRDQRVWSETGCTCVLITSTQDQLT